MKDEQLKRARGLLEMEAVDMEELFGTDFGDNAWWITRIIKETVAFILNGERGGYL